MKTYISILLFIAAGTIVAGATEKWQSSELIGYSFTRVSMTAIEAFRFTEQGDAVAEFGSKCGPICGPLVSWKIDADGVLRIVLDDKTTIVLKKLKVTGDRYLVEENGQRCEYIRVDWQEYQASHKKAEK